MHFVDDAEAVDDLPQRIFVERSGHAMRRAEQRPDESPRQARRENGASERRAGAQPAARALGAALVFWGFGRHEAPGAPVGPPLTRAARFVQFKQFSGANKLLCACAPIKVVDISQCGHNGAPHFACLGAACMPPTSDFRPNHRQKVALGLSFAAMGRLAGPRRIREASSASRYAVYTSVADLVAMHALARDFGPEPRQPLRGLLPAQRPGPPPAPRPTLLDYRTRRPGARARLARPTRSARPCSSSTSDSACFSDRAAR